MNLRTAPWPSLTWLGLLNPAGSLASYLALDRAFPTWPILRTWSGCHVSSVVDLTWEMCTPRPRWMPEHCMQI